MRFVLQLAEGFEDRDDVVVAKMDSTINELEHTKVTSFPTIKLYAKGDNKVSTHSTFKVSTESEISVHQLTNTIGLSIRHVVLICTFFK